MDNFGHLITIFDKSSMELTQKQELSVEVSNITNVSSKLMCVRCAVEVLKVQTQKKVDARWMEEREG